MTHKRGDYRITSFLLQKLGPNDRQSGTRTWSRAGGLELEHCSDRALSTSTETLSTLWHSHLGVIIEYYSWSSHYTGLVTDALEPVWCNLTSWLLWGFAVVDVLSLQIYSTLPFLACWILS